MVSRAGKQLRRLARRLWAAQQGLTLVELMVVVGIMSLAVSMVGTGLVQTLTLQRAWREDMVAVKDLRHAGSLFGGDLMNAQTSSLADGGSSTSSFTVTWLDTAEVTHTITYSKVGDTLVRNYDSAAQVVAQRVTAVSFARAGNVITLTLTVQAENGTTEQNSWQVYLRRLNA